MATVEALANRAPQVNTRETRALSNQARNLLGTKLARRIFSPETLQALKGSLLTKLTQAVVDLLIRAQGMRNGAGALSQDNLRLQNPAANAVLDTLAQALTDATGRTFAVQFSNGTGFQIALTGDAREEQALPSTQEESAARQSQLGIEPPPPSAARKIAIGLLKNGLALATWMTPEDLPLELALSPGATTALKISLGIEVPRVAKWLFRQFVIIDAPAEPTANPEPATA